MQIRPRRLRQNEAIRNLVAENIITNHDLIYPIFIKEGEGIKESIETMPGIYRWSLDTVMTEIEEALKLGIRAIALFPVIPIEQKSLDASEAYNPDGFTQKAIRVIKSKFPQLLIVSDIALDPYTIHGHDGLLENGRIANDATVEALCRMALVQAQAGSDIVAPSDMMDGRIGAIRQALDKHGFHNTMIMSYTAKYASCLYGPFRDALGSLGSSTLEEHGLTEADVPKDKKTYQMLPNNAREAGRELSLDLNEGADIVMVKPASWYLDVVQNYKKHSPVPVAHIK